MSSFGLISFQSGARGQGHGKTVDSSPEEAVAIGNIHLEPFHLQPQQPAGRSQGRASRGLLSEHGHQVLAQAHQGLQVPRGALLAASPHGGSVRGREGNSSG